MPSILNEQVGVGVMSVLNCAQLSELRQRAVITHDDLVEFSRRTAGDARDPWQGGDRIIKALTEPYRRNRKITARES